MIRRETAIAGIGQTAYAKALPPAAWELATFEHGRKYAQAIAAAESGRS